MFKIAVKYCFPKYGKSDISICFSPLVLILMGFMKQVNKDCIGVCQSTYFILFITFLGWNKYSFKDIFSENKGT